MLRWTMLPLLPVLLLPACHSIKPYLEHYATVDANRYVVVTPAGRERLLCVRRFVTHKKEEGFDVRVVTFASVGPTKSRLAEVRSKLDSHRPLGKNLALARPGNASRAAKLSR